MADKTTSSITIAVPGKVVMSVIADFAGYPQWASGVRSAEVLESAADGRARRVRMGLDAGMIRDSYVLRYDWDGDAMVRWELAEQGAMISEMAGAYVLAERGDGLSVAFDLPTQMGYDSDAEQARGEVGKVGVAIDSVDDMRTLLDGIPLDTVSTSMTINAPAAVLLLLYQLVAEEQGTSPAKISGTIQNDILKEYIARG